MSLYIISGIALIIIIIIIVVYFVYAWQTTTPQGGANIPPTQPSIPFIPPPQPPVEPSEPQMPLVETPQQPIPQGGTTIPTPQPTPQPAPQPQPQGDTTIPPSPSLAGRRVNVCSIDAKYCMHTEGDPNNPYYNGRIVHLWTDESVNPEGLPHHINAIFEFDEKDRLCAAGNTEYCLRRDPNNGYLTFNTSGFTPSNSEWVMVDHQICRKTHPNVCIRPVDDLFARGQRLVAIGHKGPMYGAFRN